MVTSMIIKILTFRIDWRL